jgi:acetyltransferase-like isoleucine patch superfamily enzyme
MKALIQAIAVLPFLGVAALAAGLSLGAAVWSYSALSPQLQSLGEPWRYPAIGILLVLCYGAYGFTLIVVAPLLNFILRARLKPWRGSAVSLGCVPWYLHACLTLVVRLSFLEFVTPSPFTVLFYRLMGMRIGKDVTINTTAIADPSLITLGDRVTIGGSASIMAHYAQGGFIVIAPVVIGAGATIGLRAIVLGDVTIGEKAKVLAGSFVLPGTVIPAGETWGGIPAAPVDLKKFRESVSC